MGLFDIFRKKNAVEAKAVSESVIRNTVEPFRVDKAEWQWDSAMENYCKQVGKSSDSLSDEDIEKIWQYAGHHIAFFLTWLIRHDFLGEDYGEEEANEIEAVKNKTITGHEFLEKYCDMVLCRKDISEKVLLFVDSYYETQYLKDYGNYMKEKVLSVAFSWEDYDGFEPVLDKAYADELKKM